MTNPTDPGLSPRAKQVGALAANLGKLVQKALQRRKCACGQTAVYAPPADNPKGPWTCIRCTPDELHIPTLASEMQALAVLVEQLYVADRCWLCCQPGRNRIASDVTGAVVCTICIEQAHSLLHPEKNLDGR